MRFRPANISLINRRHYLPRLLLTLSSKRQMQKPPQRFEDIDRSHHIREVRLRDLADVHRGARSLLIGRHDRIIQSGAQSRVKRARMQEH